MHVCVVNHFGNNRAQKQERLPETTMDGSTLLPSRRTTLLPTIRRPGQQVEGGSGGTEGTAVLWFVALLLFAIPRRLRLRSLHQRTSASR